MRIHDGHLPSSAQATGTDRQHMLRLLLSDCTFNLTLDNTACHRSDPAGAHAPMQDWYINVSICRIEEPIMRFYLQSGLTIFIAPSLRLPTSNICLPHIDCRTSASSAKHCNPALEPQNPLPSDIQLFPCQQRASSSEHPGKLRRNPKPHSLKDGCLSKSLKKCRHLASCSELCHRAAPCQPHIEPRHRRRFFVGTLGNRPLELSSPSYHGGGNACACCCGSAACC